MKITKRIAKSPYGDITLFRIENTSGASVELSSLGAGITSVKVPDKFGEIGEVALGYPDPSMYMGDGPCMGKIPGRYANRIAKGLLEIDGKEYRLNINNGPNSLHGGPSGFQNHIWNAEMIPNGVRFTYTSKDGEENYPGKVIVTAQYTWSEDNVLTLEMKAQTDAPTVINLTNHAYFNLEGDEAGSVLKHRLQMKASNYLPTDETQIPTGELAPVAGTPMDFTQPKEIGIDIQKDFEPLKIGKGYDHCWAIDNWEKGKLMEGVVMLAALSSGRTLTISSTQPGVQVYTGNWLTDTPNRSGGSYNDYDGVAIEMQGFPDAPNKPEFPSQNLNPGETYSEIIKFAFSTD